MRDFEVFPTQYGLASLVLKEIPYQGAAYITIRDSWEPEKLLEECVAFCTMCGAEKIFATGHEMLTQFPFLTAMLELRCPRDSLPDTDAALWPVQDRTLTRWREIYNRKVREIPNGAWMTERDGQQMLKTGDGYFVHRGEQLLGIGRAQGGRIDWVASVTPGAGRDTLAALAHALWEDTVTLTVASVNKKAVRLYESLGFVKTQEISCWYQVK